MGLTGRGRLALSLGISLGILVAEVVGGLVSNSLALLSDAGHVFTDSFALALSLVAARISAWPSDKKATFGYHRVGLMAAVINGASLIAIAAFIFYEAYRRFLSPPEIDLSVMLPVAVAGLLANLAMAVILSRGHVDLNIKSAWLHVVGDTMASVGVIISGVIIYFTGWVYADALASAAIGSIIVLGGVRVAKEATYIFLDLVPEGYDVDEIARRLTEVPGVKGVHGIHLRSHTHKKVAFTAHIWVLEENMREAEKVRAAVEHELRHMGIAHTVLQLECVQCSEDGLYCKACSAPPHEEEHFGHGGHGHGHAHGHQH
jgi:cobalt-zinc-cadmium efflux system protein